jgi:Putative carbonic anhydrase
MAGNEHETFYESSIPFDANRIGAVAVYCSDGRFGRQVDDLLQNSLCLPRYDRLAVPGGAACLAGHFATYREEEGVMEQLRFLVDVHGLARIILIAHQDCAFYSQRLGISPLQLESQQREDLQKAIRRVRSIARQATIHGMFARKSRTGTIQFELVRER